MITFYIEHLYQMIQLSIVQLMSRTFYQRTLVQYNTINLTQITDMKTLAMPMSAFTFSKAGNHF